jgi:hypothetical protein
MYHFFVKTGLPPEEKNGAWQIADHATEEWSSVASGQWRSPATDHGKLNP